MNKKIVSCLFSFLLLTAIVNAQVTLSGVATTHINDDIVFKTYADPFSGSEQEMGRATVDKLGNFSVTLSIQQEQMIFCHLGIYYAYFYVKPGYNYTIPIPDKKDKTAAEKLNPYYKETIVQLNIKNDQGENLNNLIFTFDTLYDPLYVKYSKYIYSKNNKNSLDSSILNILRLSPEQKDAYFNAYKKYKTGILNHLAFIQRSKSISKIYFDKNPVLSTNSAYWELFNQVFNKYFYLLGQSKTGKKIYDDINKNKSYTSLNKTLLKDSILNNDTIRELVILKNIHDEFYGSHFSRTGLLMILDSLSEKTQIVLHKVYAHSIRKKITKLMVGFEPPQFTLLDKDGKSVSLTDLKGKYVYLGFCNCSSYSCIKEYDLLKKIKEKYKELPFEIVTIIIEDNPDLLKKFIDKSGYNWLFLNYNNMPEVFEKYDIRAFPTYFLIGPDGKLIYSPAVSPAENFEYYLFQVMRSKGHV